MQSLETWFWLLEKCPDKGEQARILNEIRRLDDKTANELERMLALAEEAGEFMALSRGSKNSRQD